MSEAALTAPRRHATTAISVARGAVALLILAAVIGQLLVSIEFWTRRGDASITLDLVNFFSFFTIESNVLAMVVLTTLVLARLRGRALGRRFDLVLVSATTYMLVTGIVYNTLLRGIELPQGATLPWSNEVLHLIAPLWMVLDWLLTARRRSLRWRDVAVVAVFPVIWLAYTLARGPVTLDQATGDPSWYPYPFLDPANFDAGYAAVAGYCVVVAAAVLLGAAALIAVSRRPASRPDPALSITTAED